MKTLLWSKRWISYLVLMMGLTIVSLANAATSPEAIIEAESQKLLAMLDKEGASYDTNPQALYAKVTNQLRGIADIPAIARGIMGSYYKAATVDQQKRFVGIFEKSLVKIYSDSLMKAKPTSITVVPSKKANASARKGKVSVNIATKDGSVYQVSYSMLLNKEDKWLVRNIVVDGINFGLTYRNQFKSEMQQSNDMDSVINNWTKAVNK